MKNGIALAIALTLVAGVWGGLSWVVPVTDSIGPVAAFAADDDSPVKGSVSKGKYYFKKTCKPCHTSKDEGGEVTPMSKTVKQWERYLEKGVHRKITKGDTKVKEPILDVSGDEKIDAIEDKTERARKLEEKVIHIRTFLIHHAADSAQPETCG